MAQLPQKTGAEPEQRFAVEPLQSEPRHERGNVAKPVGAYNFALFLIPEEQVPIVRVEPVQIDGFPGAFAGRAESDFAQTSDFLERERDVRRIGEINGKIARLFEQARTRQSRDLICQRFIRNSVRHRNKSA